MSDWSPTILKAGACLLIAVLLLVWFYALARLVVAAAARSWKQFTNKE